MSNGRRLNTPVKKPYTPSATPTGKINVTDPGGDHDPLVVDDGLCVVALDVGLSRVRRRPGYQASNLKE
ncbi:MAG: hypothetical protein QOF69_3953 [Solirubrobacteraceae bacterium]|nr:hypothetical protein [Solirubrobacteraceae bacterium]